MYEQFYNFEEKPFTLLPDPAFLYLGKKHQMALTMLQYGLANNSGFIEAVVQVATVIAAAAIKNVCPIALAAKNV